VVPPEACGGGEAFGRKQTAPPCYGKAVGYLTRINWPPAMDTIKGLALIGTFIGVLITFAMWVSLWENVWQASVEPTRAPRWFPTITHL
jgi:hypothetical protein